MKKLIISVGVMLAIVSAVITMSLVQEDEEMVVEQTGQVMSFSGAEPAEQAALQSGRQVKGELVFSDVKYSADENVVLTARLTDSQTEEPVQGLKVTAFCKDIKTAEAKTVENGSFQLTADDDCKAGDNVWVEAEYNGEAYEQSFIMMLGSSTTGGKNPSIEARQKLSTLSQDPKGVPEFSTITIAMAVIGGCLGLAFLRKE